MQLCLKINHFDAYLENKVHKNREKVGMKEMGAGADPGFLPGEGAKVLFDPQNRRLDLPAAKFGHFTLTGSYISSKPKKVHSEWLERDAAS